MGGFSRCGRLHDLIHPAPAIRQAVSAFRLQFHARAAPNYRVGVPDPGVYREILNGDSELWGGSNMGNGGCVGSEPISYNGHYHSLSITLPPLAVVVFESPQS